MSGLYALASAGLVCVAFLAGRRFPVVAGRRPPTGRPPYRADDRRDGAAEMAVPRLTGPVAASSAGVSADAFADLERRVTALERTARRRSRPAPRADRAERADRADRVDRAVPLGPPIDEPPLDKPAAVSHYEALADQVARERRLADVEPRGRVMRFPSRPLAVARDHQDR